MKKSLFFLLLLFLAFSCKPKKNFIYMSNNNFEQEVSQARYEGLRIQEGDVLEVIITAMDDLAVKPFNKTSIVQTGEEGGSGAMRLGNNQYQVTTDGYIAFPTLGNIYCKGMTKQQLKVEFEARLKQYLVDPVVTIQLVNFNISVLGDVGSPGQKTSLTERLNIFQALALAGDMRSSANRTNVKLIRYSEESGKDLTYQLDLSEASIVNSPYYYLQQNDILYIEPDKNAQIAANTTNPNRTLFIQTLGVVLGLITFVIAIAK
ncbi:polysaccharide biosynthesis/export family protein [Epilithonimonas sp. JDS]|uniref:polysaccharide biosynthesis/export family protein n=1 Tax=Epilithonimonas sp. JDS TaxID=2902797 RepID=UPI001E4593BE|nr:polysaccharide biosynthesis/export family protein [Epilithonimonas sp. JDS]MCD9853826.1 polysaccharide biosynthesis/export family protein [Epilithonimonas sp. JDS]